ncbi:tannase/feruloyl esterase family alpha/beta hydrolase [Nocardioides coralli]|uniref:tannase/feruloyl esterase family alpha/beta hydrolase n=1 Tax=Nocardioides coralli TaxID=2872154 RepID=UPI001CA3E4DF|nr:tannase/feruloyl esterase family alpha/beta hydrolase [Nocardioides coralli]QZY30302.1 tannase/feruloyl esterase family alpha/beta hydrolase [Nocardioides coralli]
MSRTTAAAAATAAIALGLSLLAAPAAISVEPAVASAGPGHCAREARIDVPRAEVQETACLDDLTTAGTQRTGHTDPADWSGLHAPGTRNPSGVPGIQVDGYFPDTSTSNTHHGWNHDSQFVIRLPDDWNGRLVVSGAPGTRTQYAGDYIFSDWLVARGYAYAMTDKGNNGGSFHADGDQPGDAVAEWNRRVTQLTRATRAVLRQRYGREPRRTYAFGISNGGYLVRWQLENRPGLYDGGVDWEGTLYRAQPPNLLTYLPEALTHYPAYAATGDESARKAMIAAGFHPRSEFTWEYHYSVYWDLTQRLYREEFDPSYDGELVAGVPFCQSGTPRCDADYDYAERPGARRAMAEVALTGDVRRPMLTLHGTLDALLPIRTDSDVYRPMVRRAGRAGLHRYYRIRGGTHVDGLHGTFGDRVRPLLPCARRAFQRLTAWVEDGRRPPADATVPRPPAGTDQVNRCSLR